MHLGTHYIALAVKDIKRSKAFYEKLGFEADSRRGGVEEKWLVMINGDIKIGLFQDMFPRNVLTFNPPDARALHERLEMEDGIEIAQAANMDRESGPCHFSIIDADGNPILFDQLETEG